MSSESSTTPLVTNGDLPKPESPSVFRSVPEQLIELFHIPKEAFTLVNDEYNKFVETHNSFNQCIIKLTTPEVLKSDQYKVPSHNDRVGLLDAIQKTKIANLEAIKAIQLFYNNIQLKKRQIDTLVYELNNECQLRIGQLGGFQTELNQLQTLRLSGGIKNIGYACPANQLFEWENGSHLELTSIMLPKKTKQDILDIIVGQFQPTDDHQAISLIKNDLLSPPLCWYNSLCDSIEQDLLNHGKSGHDKTDWRVVQLYFKYHGVPLPKCDILQQQLNYNWSSMESVYAKAMQERQAIEEAKVAQQARLQEQKELRDAKATQQDKRKQVIEKVANYTKKQQEQKENTVVTPVTSDNQ